MMMLDAQITRVFHDEHLQTIGFLETLDAVLSHGKDEAPATPMDDRLSRVLAALIALMDIELDTHFRFEEEALFPLLIAAGDADITELLTEEHNTIAPIGHSLSELAHQARSAGFSTETWSQFRQQALEFSERLVSHIQKEEMGLLPMLDTLVDEKQDAALSDAYLMLR